MLHINTPYHDDNLSPGLCLDWLTLFTDTFKVCLPKYNVIVMWSRVKRPAHVSNYFLPVLCSVFNLILAMRSLTSEIIVSKKNLPFFSGWVIELLYKIPNCLFNIKFDRPIKIVIIIFLGEYYLSNKEF